MENSNQLIESVFKNYEVALGNDLERYRNHVYRVFLNCLMIDPQKENEDKFAIAAVFHDLGIWTANTFDYLEPSIALAEKYLSETGRIGWAEEIKQMIYWHHKMSACSENITTVETFRRADWIDVSLGLITFGIDKNKMHINWKSFPGKGFHWFLVKATMKNFMKHPLNPLPMFKA